MKRFLDNAVPLMFCDLLNWHIQIIKHICQYNIYPVYSQESFEDMAVVIRSRKSKRDRQHNCQKKKDKRTSNDLQNITRKTKDLSARTQLNVFEITTDVKWSACCLIVCFLCNGFF